MKTFALLHKLQVHNLALQEDEYEGLCFFSLCVSNGIVYVGSSNGRIFLFKRRGRCLFQPFLFHSVIRSHTSRIVTKIFAVERLHLLIHGTDKGGIYILRSNKLDKRKCLSTERGKKERVRKLMSHFHKGAITSINCVTEEDLRCRRGRSGGNSEGTSLYVFVGDQQGVLSCIVLKKKGSRVRSEENILLIDKTNGPISHIEIERDRILVTCQRANIIMNVEDVIEKKKVNLCTIGKKENRSYYRSVFCNAKGGKGGPFILSLRKNGRVWLSHGERVKNTLVFYYPSVYFFYLFFRRGVSGEVNGMDNSWVSDGVRREDSPNDGGGASLPFHVYQKNLIKNIHLTTLLKKILKKFTNFLLPLRPNANVCYKIDKDHFVLCELANPFSSSPSGSPDGCVHKLLRNEEQNNLDNLRKDLDLIRSFIEEELENGRQVVGRGGREDQVSREKTKCLTFLLNNLDDAENILRRIKSKKIMMMNIKNIEIEEIVDLHVESFPWGCNNRRKQIQWGESDCTSNKSAHTLDKQEGKGTQGKIYCEEENKKLSVQEDNTKQCVLPKDRKHMNFISPNESLQNKGTENKTHRRRNPYWKYLHPNEIIDSVKWKKEIFLLYYNPDLESDFYVAQNISEVSFSQQDVIPWKGVQEVEEDAGEGKAQKGTHFYLCEVYTEENFELAKYLPREIEKVTHLERYSFHILLFHVSYFFKYLHAKRDSLDANFLFHVEKELVSIEEAHCLDDQINKMLLKNIEAAKRNIRHSFCMAQKMKGTGLDLITDNNYLQGVDFFRNIHAPVNPTYLHVNMKKAKKLYSLMRSTVVKYMAVFSQVVTFEVFPDTPCKGHLPYANDFNVISCVTLIRNTPHLLFQFLHYFHIFVYLEIVITSFIYRENCCFRKFPMYVPERRLGGEDNMPTSPAHIHSEVGATQRGIVNRLTSYAPVQLKGIDSSSNLYPHQFQNITRITDIVRPKGRGPSGRIGYDSSVDARGGCSKKQHHLLTESGGTYQAEFSFNRGNTFDIFDRLLLLVKGWSKKVCAKRERLVNGVSLPTHESHLSRKEFFFECNWKIIREENLRNVPPLLNTLYAYRRRKRSVVAKVCGGGMWARRPCREGISKKIRRRMPPQMNRVTRLCQGVGRTQVSAHGIDKYLEKKELRNNGKISSTQIEEEKGKSTPIGVDPPDELIQRQQSQLHKIVNLRKLLRNYMENASWKKGIILKDHMTIQNFLKYAERLYFYRKITEGVYIVNLNEYRHIYECLFLYDLFIKLFDTEIVLFRLHTNCKAKMNLNSNENRARTILWRTSSRKVDHQEGESSQNGMVKIVGNKEMEFFQKWNEHIIRNDILLMDILFGFYYHSEGSGNENLKSFVRKFCNFRYLAEYISYVKRGEPKGKVNQATSRTSDGAPNGIENGTMKGPTQGTSFLFSFGEGGRNASDVDVQTQCRIGNSHGGGISRFRIFEKRLDRSRTKRGESPEEAVSRPHGKTSSEQNSYNLLKKVEAKKEEGNHMKKAEMEAYRLYVKNFLRVYTHLDKKNRCTKRQRGVSVFLFFKNIDVHNFLKVVYLLCREKYHHQVPICAGSGRQPNGDLFRMKKPIWNSRKVCVHITDILRGYEESSGLKKVSSAFLAFVKDLMVEEEIEEPHVEILNQRSIQLCLQYVRHLIKGSSVYRHLARRKKKMSLLVCKMAYLLRMLNWRNALSALLGIYRSLSYEVLFFILLLERHSTELGRRTLHAIHSNYSRVLRKNRSYEDVVMHMLLDVGRNSGQYLSIMIITILNYFFENIYFLKNEYVNLEEVIRKRYSSLFLCFFKNEMFKRECIFSANLFNSFHTSDSFIFSDHSFVKHVFKRCYKYMNFQSHHFLTGLNNLLYDHFLKLCRFFQVNCSSFSHVHFCFFLLISYFYVGYYAHVYPLLRFFWDTFSALLPKLKILNCKKWEPHSCVKKGGGGGEEEEELNEKEALPTGYREDTKFFTQMKFQKDVIPSEECLLHSIDYLANFFFEMLIKFLCEVNHKVCSKEVDLVIHNIGKNQEVYLKASEILNNFYGSCEIVCSRYGENGMGKTFHKDGTVTCRRKNISVQIYDRRGKAHTLIEMLNYFFVVLCCLQSIKLSLKKGRAISVRTNRHYRKYLLAIIFGLFVGMPERRGEGMRCRMPNTRSTNSTTHGSRDFQLDRFTQKERSLSVLTCVLCITHFISYFKHVKGEVIRKFIFMLDYFLANQDSPNFEQQYWGYTPQKNIHQIYRTIITNLPTRVLPVK
ncbi:conserved Plasmodium protein, unknown function [Plasmodium knowlesi strain H]|uniref:Uncharacterized protein n=3 Tax=Plasmodium knowlesi TaxID=5850 RepID=A0A5K1V284_PLAKH|nr:conserved Plasmodium protein, unknown function [Plasmodium knowlesi strain H]OTN64594.1 Uncharacterized protein PKNOH_S130197000 [Plasmodium knowlesi]CAA9989130.1 conserved Plasmodium protein, unknown function [Plasmodium knowlesi strain H]SBO27347.1 conserved Plasmodium protein, unknown function [Plasmodium knowlesi strain H]SBO27538.1 conserved Plasmodium protein, unknown function [Plasmodium knowlesi strain H]VVS78604.1 conserved Plasmodium protein, unknown function [Plasmodium knowlesi |eukprot:XP_002261477.1 hypothetical protein, conserved in Plasmodium species [Plasmodium knowlesi strain H]